MRVEWTARASAAALAANRAGRLQDAKGILDAAVARASLLHWAAHAHV